LRCIRGEKRRRRRTGRPALADSHEPVVLVEWQRASATASTTEKIAVVARVHECAPGLSVVQISPIVRLAILS
jgi:hypothetical protein